MFHANQRKRLFYSILFLTQITMFSFSHCTPSMTGQSWKESGEEQKKKKDYKPRKYHL